MSATQRCDTYLNLALALSVPLFLSHLFSLRGCILAGARASCLLQAADEVVGIHTMNALWKVSWLADLQDLPDHTNFIEDILQVKLMRFEWKL